MNTYHNSYYQLSTLILSSICFLATINNNIQLLCSIIQSIVSIFHILSTRNYNISQTYINIQNHCHDYYFHFYQVMRYYIHYDFHYITCFQLFTSFEAIWFTGCASAAAMCAGLSLSVARSFRPRKPRNLLHEHGALGLVGSF